MSPRRYGPAGVYPHPAAVPTLSDSAWEHVELTFKERLERNPPPAFRDALNHALLTFVAAKSGIQSVTNDLEGHVSPPALPKQIRANLKRARQAALRLNDRINELDGNSRQLVEAVEPFGLTELYDAVKRAAKIISAAEALANAYPKSRATIKDYPSLYLTTYLARAIHHFCGEEALSQTRDGLFHQVLLILFEALGEPHEDRAKTMKRGIERFQEVRRRGELGPPLPWEEKPAT